MPERNNLSVKSKHCLTQATDDLPLGEMSQISERWLMEIGGWAAMKAARGLLAGGSVEIVEVSPGLVQGRVGTGKTRFVSGLRFRGGSDVDNLCTCPTARRTGQICEHALAVGLASLRTGQGGNRENRPESPLRPTSIAEKAVVLKKREAVLGRWSIFMPDSWFNGVQVTGRPLTVFLQWEPGVAELQQERLNDWLAARGLPLQSAALSVSEAEIPGWLECLLECPHLFRGKPTAGAHREIRVSEALARPRLQVSRCDDSQVQFTLMEQPAPRCLTPANSRKPWLYHETEDLVHPLGAVGDDGAVLAAELFQKRTPVLRSLRWLAEHQEDLGGAFDLRFDKDLSETFSVQNVSPQWVLKISGSLQEIEISIWGTFQNDTWEVIFGTKTGAVASPDNIRGIPAQNRSINSLFPIEDQQFNGRFYVRDFDGEATLMKRLIHRDFAVEGSSGRLKIRGERDILRFYASTLPVLEREFEIQTDPAWLRATQGLQRIAPLVRMEEGDHGETVGASDWLSMEFAYRAPDGFRLSRAEALRMVRTGQSMVKSPSGKRYVFDLEGCEALEEAIQDVPFEVREKGGQVSKIHAHYLLPFVERKSLAQMDRREVDSKIVEEQVGNLFATLRPYQITGVGWLLQRLEEGKGALLADDMGLGKTLQCIAAIRCALSESGLGSLALVVCPKSLLSNWEAEFKRFAPELNVLLMEGSGRANRFKTFPDYQVILTSYQLLTRDLEQYRVLPFRMVVVDEASFIRNPTTDVARAVHALQAQGRIALSGTPVENRVRDLWSIFQFILPGYLGRPESFRERFEKPMEKQEGDRVRVADRLRRLVKPFVLRRTKREVLTELPEKIEQILWCEMSPVQGEVYRRLLEEGREEIRGARRRGHSGSARMTMFTVLLRLRQACCDLRLLGLSEEVTSGLSLEEVSGKWPIWQERLEEALLGGGKVLVFSQFVSYLHRARDILDELKIGYSYLDGSTRDRGDVVRAFQEEGDRRVFLISLKAGGYGLNLTQADHVILMDPWWNPAVEAQAIDRAHRFGQQKVVTAGRLIMRGTVEERILALQGKKRDLIASAIDEGAPMMEGLSESELDELLSD